jgi:hypothetical protein
VRRECPPPAGAIGPQLRIVAHFAPTGVAVFCRLFIGKLTTFEGMRSRPVLVARPSVTVKKKRSAPQCSSFIRSGSATPSLDHVRGRLHDGTFAGVSSQSSVCNAGAPGKTAGETAATAARSNTSGAAVELERTRKMIAECARVPNTVKRRHLPRRTPPTTRYGSPGPFDAEVLAEIGPPSAIAQNEFSARLRHHARKPRVSRAVHRAAIVNPTALVPGAGFFARFGGPDLRARLPKDLPGAPRRFPRSGWVPKSTRLPRSTAEEGTAFGRTAFSS